LPTASHSDDSGLLLSAVVVSLSLGSSARTSVVLACVGATACVPCVLSSIGVFGKPASGSCGLFPPPGFPGSPCAPPALAALEADVLVVAVIPWPDVSTAATTVTPAAEVSKDSVGGDVVGSGITTGWNWATEIVNTVPRSWLSLGLLWE